MLMKEQVFDVILSMYDLPGMKGIDLVRAVRANGCDAPIIFYDRMEEMKRATEVQERKKGETTSFSDLPLVVGTLFRPEQRSHQIETLFRTLADRTTIAILVQCNGKLIYANHAAEELTGYDRKELQLIDPLTLVHPAEREEVRTQGWQRLEDSCPAERYSLRIVQKAGMERLVEITTERCTAAENQVLIISACDLKNTDEISCSPCSSVPDLYFWTGADGAPEGLEGTPQNTGIDLDEEFSRNKALIAALLETTKDGILATDTSGRPIACNGVFRTMWGIPGTPFLDRGDLLEVIAAHLKNPEEWCDLIRKDTCRPGTVSEGVVECTDGRSIAYLSAPQKIGDEITGMVWSFSDITRARETGNAVLEREHFFIVLLNAIRDGVLILSKNGRVRYANSAAGELFGLPCAGDCVGRNILEFVHQDSIHALFRDLLSIRGGSDAIPAEYALITPSGEVRQVESLSSSILWNEEKAIAFTLRDITERKQAETAAQESADLNRALIDGLPEYIFVLGGEGKVVFTNPAAEAALGCTPGAMAGKTMRSFIAESSLQDFDAAGQEAFAGQKPRSFEIGIKTVTGEVLQVTLRAAPITFRNQDAVLLLLTDLTERLILEKELEYHARELKRFSESLTRINEKLTIMNSITRHDILNQLTVLLGYLEIAAEESNEPGTLESLDKMKLAAQNIREQLEFARDYQDLGVQEPQWFNVRRQVTRLRHDGVTINTTIQKIEVFADPLFERVFYNLLDNAVRHGNNVTKIRVTIRPEEDGTLTIVWEDNGIGVREDAKEKIFKRGYGSNTGLGLFLCREILAITGMTIHECGEYGKGARFEIRVPREGYRGED